MSSYHQHQEIHTRLEEAQRQLSRIVAFGIIGSFFVFMAGYYAGKRYILEESHGVVLSDSFGDALYGFYCSTHEIFRPYREDTRGDKAFENQKSPLKTEQKRGPWYALMGCYSTLKEAQALVALLKSYGFEGSLEPSSSSSQEGTLYHWYKVVLYQDRKKDDFLRALEVLKYKSGITIKVLHKNHEADDAVL